MEVVFLLLQLVAIFQAGFCAHEPKETENDLVLGKYPRDYPTPDNAGEVVPIWPPKYDPGEIIDDLEFFEVTDALDEVMRAGDIMHDRRCALSVSNEAGHALTNAQWYLSSGGIHTPPGQPVEAGYTGLNLFLKTPWAARGAVGVLTYEIEGTDYKLAIMYHVPFDRNLYDNYFNTKIYPKSFGTNKDMFNQMYDDAGPWKANGWKDRTEFGIVMRGVMTDNTKSKVSVWINSENFDPNGQPHLNAGCSYHPWKVRNMCWRECYPEGWCWMDKRCSSGGDCNSLPEKCDSGC